MNNLKGLLVMIGLFVLAVVLAITDPINLNKDSESWLPALYVIPSLILGIFLYKRLNR